MVWDTLIKAMSLLTDFSCRFLKSAIFLKKQAIVPGHFARGNLTPTSAFVMQLFVKLIGSKNLLLH